MLKINNYSVRFSENGTAVCEDIVLTVKKGEKRIIIGETGSGKSVLLLGILKLLPEEAIVSGEVILNGIDLSSRTFEEMCEIREKKIAYIPQGSGNSLNPLMKIERQLGEAMGLYGFRNRKKRKEKVIEMLKRYNLGQEEKVAEAYPHQLSGGMKQRILVAMGMGKNADIILADEPTKGVDKKRRDLIEDDFIRQDTAILCITHDIHFARRVADFIVVMYAAQQVECCTKEEFFSEPLHPYSRALLDALPQNGAKVSMGFAPPHSEYKNYGCRFADRCPCKFEKCKEKPPLYQVGNRKVRCHLYADQCKEYFKKL